MATFKRLLRANRVGQMEKEASGEHEGRDWRREMVEELALLSAAWTGYPLSPRSSLFDDHERQEKQ
jgi:hypothetical protein